MRLFLLISCLFLHSSYTLAFDCEGVFEREPGKTYPSMSTWNWSYSNANTKLVGDQKAYDGQLLIGAAENKECANSEECLVLDTVCAVKTSLRSILNENEEIDTSIRLRVVSYSLYFALLERMKDSLNADKSCENRHEDYYSALKVFWMDAFRDVGYRVTEVHPFEVKFEQKPEYLSDGECFHKIDHLKDKLASLEIPGNPYRLAWARIGFGVSWYGTDFFPAFDIEKIKQSVEREEKKQLGGKRVY